MAYQTIYNPATGQIQVMDLSQSDAQQKIMALYQQGWTSATAQQTQYAQQQAPQAYQPPKTITQTSTTTPTQTTSALNKYIVGGQIDLVQVAKAKDEAALTEARQLFGWEKVSMARDLAKTPVTEEEYSKLGERTKKEVRVVRPISKEEYEKLSDTQKVHWYPEAEGVSAQVYAQLGAGVKERGLFYPQLKWYEHLTSVKEEEGEQVTAKSFTLQVGDAVVPFMYTARNWNEMQDWEKGVHLFADVVFTATMLAGAKPIAKNLKLRLTQPTTKPITSLKEYTASGQVKVMKPTAQAKMEYKALQDLAKETGQARVQLRLAREAVLNAEKSGIMPKNMVLPSNRVQRALMDNLDKAVQKSLLNDGKFGNTIPNAPAMNLKQIKKLEKLSGFQGLESSIKDINRIEGELKQLWAAYEKIPAKSSSFYRATQLTEIDRVHKRLERAYETYSHTIAPVQRVPKHWSTSKLMEFETAGMRVPRSQPPKIPRVPARAWAKLKGEEGVKRFVSLDTPQDVDVAREGLGKLQKLYRKWLVTNKPDEELAELKSYIKTFERKLLQREKDFAEEEAMRLTGTDPKVPQSQFAGKVESAKAEMKAGQGKGYGSQGQWTKEQFEAEVKRVADINAKQAKPWEPKPEAGAQQEFWDMASKTKTKTAVREEEKAEGNLEKLFDIKKKAEAKATEETIFEEKVKAPKIEEQPKFGMKPKDKVKVTAREIPQEARGRMTFAQIAREYGEQAVEDAIGVPIGSLNTAGQIKTAIQINQEFETKLAGATNAATQALINTYTRTNNMNQAEVGAQNALENFLKTQPATQTQLETKTQLAVDVAVKEAVEDIIRMKYKVVPKFVPKPAQDEGLQIERVEGIPRDPGIISWNKGISGIEITPPYREGSEDVHFTKLKQPQKGKGSQEKTLKVRGGKAPALVVLGRQGGIAKTHIIKGRRMVHTRQRGPGILTPSGKFRRVRRGSVI